MSHYDNLPHPDHVQGHICTVKIYPLPNIKRHANKDHEQKSKTDRAGRTKVFNPSSLHLFP
jgi:hypothetical protein